MNGVCEIQIGNKKHPLKFGMVAIEEFSRLLSDNPSTNANKTMVELIFAGLMNHAIMNRKPVMPFNEVYELVENFNDEPDAIDQYTAVFNCFQESKHGANWMEAIENINKESKKKATVK